MKHCKGLGRGLATFAIGILLLGAIAPLFASYQASAAGISWHTETVDSSGNVGYYTSIAFDSDGDPAISYFDYAQADLKYAHWNGSSWVVATVDSTGQVGLYTSLAFDPKDKNPSISYYDATNYDLKYAHWNGSSWVRQTVDTAGNVGSYTSLAFDPKDNFPAISYYDATNQALKYAHWDGSQWDKDDEVDEDGNVGTYTSLAFDSSNSPAISYYDATNSDLKLAWDRNNDGDFSDAEEIVTVDSTVPEETEDVGRYTSLAFDAMGYPGMSYYGAGGQLKFAHWNGSQWDVEVVGAGGQYTSLAFDPAGYPNISYYDSSNHNLKYAHQKGSSWVMETVDSGGSVGTHTSLAFDTKGNPWISYYDQTNGYLKCATTAPRPTAPPYQPDNISPTNEATDISLTPTLRSSAFSDPDAGDPHAASQWQITTTPGDYTVPAKIYDSEVDTSNPVDITIPSGTLSIDTTYYWRVRHQDSYGNWSDWSMETSFTTALMQPPVRPSNISPDHEDTDIIPTPTLQSSDFSDPDAGDPHAASQWQITTTEGDYTVPAKIYDSETDTSNLVEITIPSATLSYDTTYYWRVRHQDSYGKWSSWSEETAFTTVASGAPFQPSNISPIDGVSDISVTPTLRSSAFSDPDAGDTHGASRWQIRTGTGSYSSPLFDSGIDTTNLTQLSLPLERLGYEATYYWRVKYQDSYGNWSDWSEETSFTTVTTSPPNLPMNTSPAEGAIEVSLTLVLKSSDFSDPDVVDNHAASQWQIRTSDGDYDNPVFDSQTDTTNLTEIALPSGTLSPNTTYYWQVRHQDSYGNWSAYSHETSFATITVPAPEAGFSISAEEVELGTAIILTDLSEEAMSWIWDLGDGTTEEWGIINRPRDGQFSYTYATAGVYTVSLTASNLAGSDIQTADITVYATPQANFSAPAQAEEGQTLTFTDLSTGDIDSWKWSFGDGTTKRWDIDTRPDNGKLTHAYDIAGSYTVSLEVSGPRDGNTQTKTVTVVAPPAEGFKFGAWMIGAIVGGILVIAGLVYLVWRRRAEVS